MNLKIIFILTFFCIYQHSLSQDTVRLLYYNILDYPGETPERVSYFRIVNQHINADIIMVSEVMTDASCEYLLDNGLNVFGQTKYSKAIFTDGMGTENMLFFNHTKFGLIAQDTIHTEYRLINNYLLYYKSNEPITDTIFLNPYIAHLSPSPGSANAQLRLGEVMDYKAYIDTLVGLKNMIFAGDLNLQTSLEPAYDSLINYGNYPLFDVKAAGDWHEDEDYADIHTQSTRTILFGGGTNGGLNDRFDFILFEDDLLSGYNGIRYIKNSYTTIGNDGNHFDIAIIDPPENSSVPDSVLQALYLLTDHLPVMCDLVVQPLQLFNLEIKALLEGPFKNGEMNTDLLDVIPLSQPFNYAPFDYFGSESVSSIPDDVTDWILLEIRDAPSSELATVETLRLRKAVFVKSDGSIVDTNGQIIQLKFSLFDSLFVIVRHRNHLDVMSSGPLKLTEGKYKWDFTTSFDKTYLGASCIKELSLGNWGLISGDINGDGIINIIDKDPQWDENAGVSGYLSSDLNLDTQVDNIDKDLFWLLNNGKESQIP